MLWTDGNGYFYQGDMRPGDRAATSDEQAAWAAAHNTHWVSYNQWLALFTDAEKAWAFADSVDPRVREFITRGAAAGQIDLNASDAATFLALCKSLGSPLTDPRIAAIKAGMPPA